MTCYVTSGTLNGTHYFGALIFLHFIIIIIIITYLYSALRSEDTEALERYRGAWFLLAGLSNTLK